jgi:hypothetical protein
MIEEPKRPRRSPRVLSMAIAVLVPLVCCSAAGAATGSLTFIRDGNVVLAPADGGAEFQVTHDGTAADPYTSASQSASGTVVAIRDGTAYRLTQGGQGVGTPVRLGTFASGVAAVSGDGSTLAFEELDSCSVVTPACVNTAFVSLASGARLRGYGLEMSNPTWTDGSVVGVVAGGVAVTGPDQPDQTEWFGYGPTPLPHVPGSTDTVAAAAAAAGGTRIAVVTTPGAGGERFLLLLTAAGLGAPVTGACQLELPAGPDPHPVWAPDGSALAWEDATGIHTLNIVDLSGGAACAANNTGTLISPRGTRPTWSPAAYDPRPGTDGPSGGAPAAGGGRPTFRLGSRPSLSRALRSGIRLHVTCPSRCSATATAAIDARSARRYKLPRVIARGSAPRIQPAASKTLTLRFSTRAKRRLAHAHRLRLTIAVKYRDASGATTRSTKTVVFR